LPHRYLEYHNRCHNLSCDHSKSISIYRQLIEKTLPEAVTRDMDTDTLRKKRADIAAAFQLTAVDHLTQRVGRSVDRALELEPTVKHVVVAGGVAANKMVREKLTEISASKGLEMVCPPIRLCMDNGIMVAWLGHERLRVGLCEPPPKGRAEADVERFVETRPRWPLGPRDDHLLCAQSKGKQPSAKRVRDEMEQRREAKAQRREAKVKARANDEGGGAPKGP